MTGIDTAEVWEDDAPIYVPNPEPDSLDCRVAKRSVGLWGVPGDARRGIHMLEA